VNSTADITRGELTGNVSECALIKFIRDYGCDFVHERAKFKPFVHVYPFSSDKKRMGTIIQTDDNNYRFHCKGASEIVTDLCNKVYLNGAICALEEEKKSEVLVQIDQMASSGLRTFALAYRDIPKEKKENDVTVSSAYLKVDKSDNNNNENVFGDDPPENNLTLVALLGIKDPLRPEVPDAINDCITAGIVVRMVTGDNLKTAIHIAKECGIFRDGYAYEASFFRQLSHEERLKSLPFLQVLARSQPQDKHLLVSSLQELNHVVAVTGDGMLIRVCSL
jgi:Ca2+-transporting ATPase